MASLVSAVDTEFTPAAGDFIISVTGGSATLLRKNAAANVFSAVGSGITGALVCSNPIAGAVYKFQSDKSSVVVQADQ